MPLVASKENNLPNIFDRICDAFIAFDNNKQLIYLNTKAKTLLQKEGMYAIGKTIEDLFSKFNCTAFLNGCNLAMQSQQMVVKEEMCALNNLYLQFRIYPSADGISVLIHDITKRKNAEEEITESELRFRTLTKNAPVGIFETDANGLTTYVNQTWLNYTGLSFEEAIGDAWMYIIHPEDRANQVKSWKNKTQNIEPSETEYRIINKNGQVRWVNGKAIPVINSSGKVSGYIGTIADVTELKIALELLNERTKQLGELSAHLQNIRENERTHIAREIHDELGQQLTALKMDISWLSKKNCNDHVDVKMKFEDAIILIDDTVKSIRRIGTELRPSIIDDLGLNAAMEWQVVEFRQRLDIEIKFVNTFDDTKIDPTISISLFRILQESLTNIARHSKANEVNVGMEKTGNAVQLFIQDDGVGFNITHNKNSKTFGLMGIKERVAMLNGQCSIISTPGKGTHIAVQIPLQ
ncbi:MAG TPA: PAS domain S-box protein [Ferruginibacter sp.]|nr:PAS domain S-box protein [Ferruginibacter sp.]